jgi:hypothetical protein
MKKERQSILEAEKEYEEMQKVLRDEMKKKMEKHFEENKDNLKKDKEEKEAISKFMKNKQVTAVFDAYEAQLRYFYDYYCKCEHHELTRDIDKDYETINYKEFIRFAYESNIIPTIMQVPQIVYIFHQLVREANDEDPKNGQVLNYEYFKKALVRVATVGQQLLGGQVGPKFEKKQEENKEKEMELTKKKTTLAKKFAKRESLKKKKTEKEEKSDDEGSENESPAGKKKKASDRKEGTLAERGAKPPRQKIILPNPKEDKLKSATIIKGKMDNDLLLNKKSQSINKLYELDQQARVIDNLKNIKVENQRISTECDVSIISDKTVEALLKHIGLDGVDVGGEKQKFSQELRFVMDKKLNDRRMDIQGAKPNKFRKSEVPEKADVLSNFEDAVSEEGSDAGDESETEKRKKKKEEDSDDEKDKKDKK